MKIKFITDLILFIFLKNKNNYGLKIKLKKSIKNFIFSNLINLFVLFKWFFKYQNVNEKESFNTK